MGFGTARGYQVFFSTHPQAMGTAVLCALLPSPAQINGNPQGRVADLPGIHSIPRQRRLKSALTLTMLRNGISVLPGWHQAILSVRAV